MVFIFGFWIGFAAGIAWSHWLDMTWEPQRLPPANFGENKHNPGRVPAPPPGGPAPQADEARHFT